MEVIWQNRLDNRYDVSVTRLDETTGKYVIEEKGEVVYTKTVPLSYAAKFGPDIFDVEDWEFTAIEFADGEIDA